MRFLLDSNVVIGLLNVSIPKLTRRARREKPSDIVVSSIVMHELFYGAFKSQRVTQNVALIDDLSFPVVEFDTEDARRAGEVRALLVSLGLPIGPYDLLIAGQAISRDLTLVTHNTGEFARIPGLRIEDWQV